jgi:nicotinamidase-related amidase
MSKALIVVDIQNDYFPGGAFPLVNQEAAAEKASKVINHARSSKIPVFFIKHLSADPTAVPFFLPNTPGSEIADVVKPLDGEIIIDKYYPNSFRNTTLKDELDKLKVTDLVIIGSMSQMCIEATTRAAADMNYNCVVVEDACACPDQEFKGVKVAANQVHAVAMNALAFGYAKIVSAEEYLA